MKNKITNALKTKYAHMGLGDKAFDGVASFLVKTITKEEDIDSVISSEDTINLLKAIQGSSDSLRNENAQLKKDFDAYKQSHPDKDPDPEPKPSEPEWKAEIAAIKAQLAEEKRRADNATLLAAVKGRLEKDGCTNKGILTATLKGFAAGENDTEDSLVEKYKGEYNALYKDTFGNAPIPPAGTGSSGNGEDKATIERRKAWVKQHTGETDEKK